MSIIEKLGFVIVVKDDGTYLKINDAKIDIDVLEEYINVIGVRNFDRDKILIALSKKNTTIRFSSDIIDEFNEVMKINVSNDKLEASVCFYPPSENGKKMTDSEIDTQLRNAKVIYGLKRDILDTIYKDRKYLENYVIARGDEPKQGTPAEIDYKFDINAYARSAPKLREDGTVDYNCVEMVNPVFAGELLACLIPPVLGEAGKDIYGEDIFPEKLKDVKLLPGSNVKVSEDGNEIYAICDGQAVLRTGRIAVDNIYVVQGDVDVTTGNIEFNGDIHVNGNVRSGFSVKAKGNIEINGVVEAAEITAGKNIFIRNGIQGMKRAYIVAEGNVTTKFIENATVYSKGFIESNSILYSDITSEKSITVKGNKANIVGGVVRSEGIIECYNAGSVMGSRTILQIGYPENVEDCIHDVVKSISDLRTNKQELLKVINYYKKLMRKTDETTKEQLQIVKQLVEKTKEVMCEMEQQKRTYARLKRLIDREETEEDIVIVSGQAYQGIRIEINGASLVLRDGTTNCVYKKKDEHNIKIFSR